MKDKLKGILDKLQLKDNMHCISTQIFRICEDIIIVVDNELDALCLQRELHNGYSRPSDFTFGCISIENFEFYEGYGHFKYPSEYEENGDFHEELKLIDDIKYILKNKTKLILLAFCYEQIEIENNNGDEQINGFLNEFNHSRILYSPIEIPEGTFSSIYYMAKQGVDLISWIKSAVEKYKLELENKRKPLYIPCNNEPKYTLRQLRGAWAAGKNSR